jgi:hypothetical protein
MESAFLNFKILDTLIEMTEEREALLNDVMMEFALTEFVFQHGIVYSDGNYALIRWYAL